MTCSRRSIRAQVVPLSEKGWVVELNSGPDGAVTIVTAACTHGQIQCIVNKLVEFFLNTASVYSGCP